MHEAVKNLPLDVYTMLPSCVPATPYETSGFDLNSYDLALLIDSPWVLGIAEMMNYSGLLNLDKNVLAKLDLAKSKGKRIDGHALMLQAGLSQTMNALTLKKQQKKSASVCIL